jgi:flavin-dependent thymidylate synthase
VKVDLAGYNIERDLLQVLTRGRKIAPTPETISAAYARVSRSQKSVEELRREARKEITRARKSNETIVFEMGHHSIAEHAVFNFDVVGVSRLAVEALEHHRLNAYTEKSQRYVTLEDDHLIPEEIRDTGLREDFVSTVRMQNRYYHILAEKLREYLKQRYPELQEDQVALESTAKEDARYITCLATQTQLGMTVNARNLELMVRRFAASELAEVRELGTELYREAVAVAPSLLLFCGPGDFETKTYSRLGDYAESFMIPAFTRRPRNFIAYSASDVNLVDYSQNADNKLLAALMHVSSKVSYAECLNRVERQTLARKKEIFKQACQDIQSYNEVLREFEHLYLTFELIISASCFAQIKRHRMMSMTCQPYNPNVGWTIPVSVAEIKEHKNFKEILSRTEDTYERIREHHPAAAQYVLTNSHQRRVLVTLNARELYHLARLREDMAAQWDIRDIVNRMVEQARNVMPLTLVLACGKDRYPAVYRDLYGTEPAVTSLELPCARELPKLDETSTPTGRTVPRRITVTKKARKPSRKKTTATSRKASDKGRRKTKKRATSSRKTKTRGNN